MLLSMLRVMVVAALACGTVSMSWMRNFNAGASPLRGQAPDMSCAEDDRSGLASWYGGGEPLHTHVAMGHRFDPDALEAAMWDVPFGSAVKVTNLENGRTVIVRITDRGPSRQLSDRVIDLTRASFAHLAPLERGLIPVRVERLADSGRLTSPGLPTGPTGPGSR